MTTSFMRVFPLTQHTPIIHFQHDQAGATLRATELKPKLDVFLMQCALLSKGEALPAAHLLAERFKELAERMHPEWKPWLSGNAKAGHIALDYKAQVIATGENEAFVISSAPFSSGKDPQRVSQAQRTMKAKYIGATQYFADNQYLDKGEEIQQARLGLLAKQPVLLKIVCKHPSLLRLVDQHYKAFFAATNFGTRQTKGFGCFLPQGMTEDEILNGLRQNPNVTGIFQQKFGDGFEKALQRIAADYSLLKRGSSYKTYQKSRLWEYLCKKQQLRWEKRKIKQHIKAHAPNLFDKLKYDREKAPENRIDDCENASQYQYIRALLGLAEQFEFAKNDSSRLTVKVKDAHPNDEIQRFKSPIRYLVTGSHIYLITTRINPLLHTIIDTNGTQRAREFEFQMDQLPAAHNKFRLTVPQHFDVADFISQKAGYGPNLKTTPARS